VEILRRNIMEKRQKQFLGFAMIVIVVIFTGCATKQGEFRTRFVGTWERADPSLSANTLTFSSKDVKASNQAYSWNLESISGDTYTISSSVDPDFKGTIHIKIVGNTLEIIDAYDLSNASEWTGTENDWTGTWKKK
jgi:hypothetical protein